MTQDQTTTSSDSNLMLEQLIEDGIESLQKAENTSEDWLYDLYISDALREFRRAVEIAPGEPWLWFQIGWLTLIADDDISDPDSVRTALERTLDLDPNLVAAHAALAYLEAISHIRQDCAEEFLRYAIEAGGQIGLLEEEIAASEDTETTRSLQVQLDELLAEVKQTVDGIQQRSQQAIWTGPSGEHLRAAMGRNWHELFEARNVTIPGTEVVIASYPFATGSLRVIDMLDELGEYLPTSERTHFYDIIGMGFCNGNIRPADATWCEYDIKWFKKAAQWTGEVADESELCHMYMHLCGAYAETKPPNYPAAFKSILEGYRYLVQLEDLYWYWLSYIPRPDDWNPGSHWEVVQQVIDAALDQSPFKKSLSDLGGRDLAHLTVWGARTAMRGGYRQRALSYLLRAREIDPGYSAVAELLAEVYLDESDLARALDEYKRVIDVDPTNAQAKRLIPILELAQEGSLNTQARDLILQVLPELRVGQELILEELSLQRGLMQRIAEAQKIALREVERSRNEKRAEHTYDELLNQLHRLVQEGSRIQPAAWRAAHARLAEELGPKIFNGLRAEDSRHFLITAEVFLAASRDVAGMDAAPIAVEYAKVVETELQERFLAPLEGYLESQANARLIRCGSRSIEPKRDGSWQGSFRRLGLGDMSYLLDSTAKGENDSVLGTYLRSRGIQAPLLKSVSEDLLKISQKYRNGAAHTRRLTRKDLLEFRTLLFNLENGLLRRLVELGQRAEVGNPKG